MKLIRFIPWWLIVIAMCVVLAWYFRVHVLTTTLNAMMGNSDIQEVEYDISSINFSNATIPTLKFSLSNNDRISKFHAQGINLDYQLESIGQGMIDAVHIKKIQIISTSAGVAEGNPVDISTAIASAISYLNRSIPVKNLRVDELIVSNDSFSPTLIDPITLTASTENDETNIVLAQGKSNLDIYKDNNEVTAELENGSGEIILTVDMKVSENPEMSPTIFGSVEIDLGSLQMWWLGLSKPSLFAVDKNNSNAISGYTKFELHGTLENNSWNTLLTGDLQDFGYQNLKLLGCKFYLNLRAPDSLSTINYEIELQDESNFSIEKFVNKSIEINGINLTPLGTIVRDKEKILFSLTDSSSLKFDFLKHKEFLLSTAYGTPVVDFSFTKDRTSIFINRETSLNAKKMVIGDIQIQNPNLLSNTASSFNYDTNKSERSWIFKDGIFRFLNSGISLNKLLIQSPSAQIIVDSLSANETSVRFQSNSTVVQFDSKEATFGEVAGNLERSNEELNVNGELEISGLSPRFEYFVQHNISKKKGDYKINQKNILEISDEKTPLNSLLEYWIPNTSLTQGELSINVIGDWGVSDSPQNKIQIELANANGTYYEISFSGLDTSGPIFYPPKTQSDSAEINIDRLEYGVDVENIQSSIRLNPVTTGNKLEIMIDRLSGELLGSKFESNSFEFDPNVTKNHVEISLDGLDIDKVIALQQIEGLNASGKLNGKLPIDITPNGISIELGEFWNQKGGGTIQYNVDPSQADAISNPLTDTVMKALEEFHYDFLTASANFQPNGDLSIDFHIEGKSPKLDSMHPVHLNISSEQNVLSLLKSLKYAEELNSGLDEKIRNKILSADKSDSIVKPKNQSN